MSTSNRDPRYVPPVIDRDDHVRHANRLLVGTAKGAWHAFKFLAGVAIRIPGWFLRANKRHLADKGRPSSPRAGEPRSRRR